jgi:hypothetical protein
MRTLLLVAMIGCSSSSVTGEHVGMLTTSCGMQRIANQQGNTADITRCTGVDIASDYILAVRPIADGVVEVTVAGCTVAFSTSREPAAAKPDQQCAWKNRVFSGTVAVDGQLAVVNGTTQMTLTLVPTTRDASGADIITFQGKAARK